MTGSVFIPDCDRNRLRLRPSCQKQSRARVAAGNEFKQIDKSLDFVKEKRPGSHILCRPGQLTPPEKIPRATSFRPVRDKEPGRRKGRFPTPLKKEENDCILDTAFVINTILERNIENGRRGQMDYIVLGKGKGGNGRIRTGQGWRADWENSVDPGTTQAG